MVAHAWMHLWSMSVAIPKLQAIAGAIEGEKAAAAAKENAEAAYYYGKILSGKFYLTNEIKHLDGYLAYINEGAATVNDVFDEIFTGALTQ